MPKADAPPIVTTVLQPEQLVTRLQGSPEISTRLEVGQGPAGPPGPRTGTVIAFDVTEPSKLWRIRHDQGTTSFIAQFFDGEGRPFSAYYAPVTVSEMEVHLVKPLTGTVVLMFPTPPERGGNAL